VPNDGRGFVIDTGTRHGRWRCSDATRNRRPPNDSQDDGRRLETHRQETKGQVDRLDQVFALFELSPRGKKCEAIEGIIAEAKEHMEEIGDAEVLDAGMIGSAQAVERYEITRYGTLIAWAKQLGRADAIELLQANLKQEKHADALLTEIAEAAVNQRAAA